MKKCHCSIKMNYRNNKSQPGGKTKQQPLVLVGQMEIPKELLLVVLSLRINYKAIRFQA